MQRSIVFVSLLMALVVCCYSMKDGGFVGIGIDIGTTYSHVAGNYKDEIVTIPNFQGNRITPSYVAFTQTGERLVGETALNQISKNPLNTIFNVKRLIGRMWDDKMLQNEIENVPYKVVKFKNKPCIVVDVGGKSLIFAPEEIYAMILINIKEIAENYIGKNVTHAVVTVPAYFNDAQRKATQDAATIAGLKVARIIDEPNAAAIAYGLDKGDEKKTILVFDFGGRTIDVSLIKINDRICKVLAVTGDAHLGGENFDERVVEHFIKLFKTKTGLNIRKDKRATQRLRREVEKAKHSLSFHPKAILELQYLYRNHDFYETLTRTEFEKMNMDLFLLTMTPLKQILNDTGEAKEDIDNIVLVGGSTRIPKIQQIVKAFFGKDPSKCIYPEEAFAKGAALYSSGINDDEKFGEASISKENQFPGRIDLKGITPLPTGKVQLDVTIEVDINEILKASAAERVANNNGDITITSDESNLSAEEIQRMVNDANKYSETMKQRRQARNALEEYAYHIKDQAEAGSKPRCSMSDKIIKAAQTELDWIEQHPDEEKTVYESRFSKLKESYYYHNKDEL